MLCKSPNFFESILRPEHFTYFFYFYFLASWCEKDVKFHFPGQVAEKQTIVKKWNLVKNNDIFILNKY